MHACAVYLSSGLATVASRVAAAAAVPRVAVVDIFSDPAYARSSVKLVAEPESLLRAAEAAAAEGLRAVDLAREPHPAPHPRQGAVDMISFMPLSESRADRIRDDLDSCDELAWRLGGSLGRAHGCPVLMYGPRAGRTLVETRRGTSFFRSTKAASDPEPSTSLPLDFGPAGTGAPQLLPPRTGVSIIGVQPYVTNFNVCVEGASLDECRTAANALRARFGVQVMALPHEGSTHEIGCNLQASEQSDSPSRDEVLAYVQEHLPAAATIPRAYVIGLTPDEARARAEELLPPLREADGDRPT